MNENTEKKQELHMQENEITGMIISTAIRIHTDLGPGLLETLYSKILASELTHAGIHTASEVLLPVSYHGVTYDHACRADLIVSDTVLVEIKSVEHVQPVHFKQVQTYLKLSGLHIGLLINFNTEYLKDGIRRIVNGYKY